MNEEIEVRCPNCNVFTQNVISFLERDSKVIIRCVNCQYVFIDAKELRIAGFCEKCNKKTLLQFLSQTKNICKVHSFHYSTTYNYKCSECGEVIKKEQQIGHCD